MRVALLLVALLLLAGCDSSSKQTAVVKSPNAPRAARCTERILSGVDGKRGPLVRKYIRQTYCNRFAGTGWVYADGTLSIKAHIWLMHAGSCSESVGDEPAISVPCKPMYDPLDCALLHYVRRPQAQAYIHRIEKTHRVTCDDGTPLAELGAT